MVNFFAVLVKLYFFGCKNEGDFLRAYFSPNVSEVFPSLKIHDLDRAIDVQNVLASFFFFTLRNKNHTGTEIRVTLLQHLKDEFKQDDD